MDVKLGAAIDFDLMLDQTLGSAKVKLAFLDVSRDNWFSRIGQPGSIRVDVMQASVPDDTLTAYAAQVGRGADDGPPDAVRPFTRALVANLTAPGVEIQQAMTRVRAQVKEETNGQQLPPVVTNLTSSYYLVPAPR